MDISDILIIYPLALLLDFLFKDIEIWPHPVRGIGFLLDKFENLSRKYSFFSLRYRGLFFLFLCCGISGGLVNILITIPGLGILFKIYFAYAGLSLGGLLDKGREILYELEMGNIECARKYLSFLMSRDTSRMNEKEILKSLSETISENFNDGFIAPFFYLLLGGPIFLWIYKTISTMDSMWGYKTEEWRELGWAGAKADDILNFLPARLSFLLIFLFAMLFFKDKDLLWLSEVIIRNGGKENKGIPIGNLTSQFLANVYLNPFDHFIKEELRVKHYLRYMDDFVVFVQKKSLLKLGQSFNQKLKQ